MINAALIIPLPPSTKVEDTRGLTKKAVGLYPCINAFSCGEYVLLKLNNAGSPQGFCSAKEITVCGCKRKAEGIAEDIPEQTFEIYQKRLEEVTADWPMSDPYRQYLEQAWATYNQEQEAANEQDSVPE